MSLVLLIVLTFRWGPPLGAFFAQREFGVCKNQGPSQSQCTMLECSPLQSPGRGRSLYFFQKQAKSCLL